LSEQSIPQDAGASIPGGGPRRDAHEEELRRFEDASIAFYLLVDAGRPERLEEVGGLMDRLASEAGLSS
jgi:hypothetical protein